MTENTKYIGQLIKQNVLEIDPNAEVILYGSRARGDEKKYSDWDILVLTNYKTGFEKERIFRNNLYELELELGEAFSVFAYSKKEWNTKHRITPFYYNVIKDGVKL